MNSQIQAHGVIMFITFGLLLPVAGGLSRYFKDPSRNWLLLHKLLAFAASLLFVIGLGLAIQNRNGPASTHSILGYFVLVALIGHFSFAIWKYFKSPKSARFGEKIERDSIDLHGLSGKVIILLGLGQIAIGIQYLNLIYNKAYQGFISAYIVYLVLLGCSVTVLETIRYRKLNEEAEVLNMESPARSTMMHY